MGMCIGCSPNNAEQSVITQAIAVLRKYGSDAHVYLPGVGMLNGLQAGNYIDSAGTTQGTVDQPVGLVLDAAGGLGVELIDNSVGALGSTYAIRCTSTAVGSGFYFVIGGGVFAAAVATPDPLVTFGKTYKVILDVSGVAGGVVNLYLSSGQNGGLASTPFLTGNTVGVFEAIVTPDIATRDCITALCGASGKSITFKVSVREVTGIHASQPTTSNKCILRQTGGRYNWVFDATDLLTATFPAGNESVTVIDALGTGQVTTTGVNVVGAYSMGPSVTLYGRMVIKGALSASELALLQSYANRLAGF